MPKVFSVQSSEISGTCVSFDLMFESGLVQLDDFRDVFQIIFNCEGGI